MGASPICDFEIICEFSDSKLSDWWDIRKYKQLPDIIELQEKGVVDGKEYTIGYIYCGKSYKNQIHEVMELEKNNNCYCISHDIDIINNVMQKGKCIWNSRKTTESNIQQWTIGE